MTCVLNEWVGAQNTININLFVLLTLFFILSPSLSPFTLAAALDGPGANRNQQISKLIEVKGRIMGIRNGGTQVGHRGACAPPRVFSLKE